MRHDMLRHLFTNLTFFYFVRYINWVLGVALNLMIIILIFSIMFDLSVDKARHAVTIARGRVNGQMGGGKGKVRHFLSGK